MITKVFPYTGNEEKILKAVATITDPVVQTLSPLGGNVMLPLSDGRVVVSNDGITIAKAISSADEFENNIIKLIREASLRTNAEAGDGTTTSILLTSVLIREGIKLKRDGMNPIELTEGIKKGGDAVLKRITPMIKTIDNDTDLSNVALISANGNDKVAKNVVETLGVTGLDGMVFIDYSKKANDELQKDIGYIVKAGMFRPEMQGSDGRGMIVSMVNVPVLVTDKRLYYKEEAEAILEAIYQGGWAEAVIVARDYIGEFINVILTNHKNLGGKFNILLVKDPQATETTSESLEDLACYLDTTVISEKGGKLVGAITPESFATASRVFADGTKTVIQVEGNGSNSRLSLRVAGLRSELKKDKDNDVIKGRISSLTSGMVKILVGGSTPAEVQERIYRYEDAINATRAAMRGGYIVGGGIALLNSYSAKDYDAEFSGVFKRFTEASVRQIAKNSGKDADYVVENIRGLHEDLELNTIGYDAKSKSYLDLLSVGVVDPADVLRLAVENSVSAAINILSVNYFLTEVKEKQHGK